MSSTRQKHKLAVYQMWERQPDGPFLTRDHAPVGLRTPNGIIWGHTIHDFFWIPRMHGLNVMTCWSRSMITMFGEESPKEQLMIEEPAPRKLRPWPVLKFRDDVVAEVVEKYGKTFGFVDQSCAFNHRLPPLPVDEVDEEDFMPVEKKKEEDNTSNEADVDDSATSPPSIPKLEETLPPELLPEILIVDDPRSVTTRYRDQMDDDAFHKGASDKESDDGDEDNDSKDDSDKKDASGDAEMADDSKGHSGDDAKDKDDDKMSVDSPVKEKDESSSTTSSKRSAKRKEIRYKRVYPRLPEDHKGPNREAHLSFSNAPLLGIGHHSMVHLTTFTLPPPFTSKTDGKVLVAAKTAFNQEDIDFEEDAKKLLLNEARVYNRFPPVLSEHWCGLNLLTPHLKHPSPVGAVVPNFYGYYVPEDEKSLASPILLVEECGTPVHASRLTPDERTECLALLLRLHSKKFGHNSFYVRNILRQPGPLTVPSRARSDKTPSFRIIDFGRTVQIDNDAEEPSSRSDQGRPMRAGEYDWAKKELCLPYEEY